jgi:1-deoxy-D-xylulose-5-phosphate synthase
MREGSGLVEYSERFPNRYFDVGIAEQHAVTLAAGLACEGLRPVVAIYSTFLQRAYDQLVHDVAIQKLPVTFAIDRAGLVGPDGPTHAGSFDLSFMRCIPEMLIMAPTDENECRKMLSTAHEWDGPAAVRYPRGGGTGAAVEPGFATLEIGKGELVRPGRRIALLAFGALLAPALEVGEAVNASVANMRFIKPLDTELLQELAKTHELLVTLEDNAVAGGAGSAVNEALALLNIHTPVLNLGLPDEFVEQGGREELLSDCGLDAAGIMAAINQRLTAENCAADSDRLVS